MESLTIAWYALTILIVVIFLVIIIFTKSKCVTRPPQRSADPVKPLPSRQPAPLTPAPAYSEFAPPSYDEVVRQYVPKNASSSSTPIGTPSIFVITLNEKQSSSCQQQQQQAAVTSPIASAAGVTSMRESPA